MAKKMPEAVKVALQKKKSSRKGKRPVPAHLKNFLFKKKDEYPEVKKSGKRTTVVRKAASRKAVSRKATTGKRKRGRPLGSKTRDTSKMVAAQRKRRARERKQKGGSRRSAKR